MILEPVQLGKLKLINRIFRSATMEGMCDAEGIPTEDYYNLYRELSEQEIGGIITGFAYIRKDGRAVHPGQAGFDSDDKINVYQRMTNEVHKSNSKIFLQLAHCGYQTSSKITQTQLRSVSANRSSYFLGHPQTFTTTEVYAVINDFAEAVRRAQLAGFDGVQLHAAHGYLLHQFIHPKINRRNDIFGIDKKLGIGISFLLILIEEIIKKVWEKLSYLAQNKWR